MNRERMRHLARTDPEALFDYIDKILNQWQIAVDQRNRLEKSNGSHYRPKPRGKVDIKSVEHAAKDTGKFGLAGGTVFLGAVGTQIVSKIESGEIDVTHAILEAFKASEEWGVIILGLGAAYFLILLAFKGLARYP